MEIRTASGSVYPVLRWTKNGTPVVADPATGAECAFVALKPTRVGLAEEFLGKVFEPRADGVLALRGHGFKPGRPVAGWPALLVAGRRIMRITTEVVSV